MKTRYYLLTATLVMGMAMLITSCGGMIDAFLGTEDNPVVNNPIVSSDGAVPGGKLVANVVLTKEDEWVYLKDGDVVTGKGGPETSLRMIGDITVTLLDVDLSDVIYCDCKDGDSDCHPTIILAGKNVIEAEGFAISVYGGDDSCLTIKGDGQLTASSENTSVIGYNSYDDPGKIVIESGTIIATTGSGRDTVIGSSFFGGGDIVINGGTIFASCKSEGAAIGSSDYSSCGNITINGGTVKATNEGAGVAIGSSDHGKCGNITINGGVISAKGGYISPAIGGKICGDITFTGGSVTAIAGEDNIPAIGSGWSESTCGDITITNGITSLITAITSYEWSRDKLKYIGLGPNAENSICGTITIDGVKMTEEMLKYPESIPTGTFSQLVSKVEEGKWILTNCANVILTEQSGIVYPRNGDIVTGKGGVNTRLRIANNTSITLLNVDISQQEDCAAIECYGVDEANQNPTIVLSGKNVLKGANGYPAIYIENGGTVTVTGDGQLFATGGEGAAAIGASGGKDASCGNIIISGGDITAIAGLHAAAIGSGYDNSSCGNITITDGITKLSVGFGSTESNHYIGPGDNSTSGTVTIDGAQMSDTYLNQPWRILDGTFTNLDSYIVDDKWTLAKKVSK